MRILRWAIPIAVLAIAFGLRFWALGRPSTLVFDELYYVRDAISQLTHGFPTNWPDDDPDMSNGRALAFTAEASNAVHPPLGKWLIGLGVLLFGPESGWGWRSVVAAAGVATVGVTMRLGFLLSRSVVVAWLAGFLLALDGVHVTLSRVGLLDGFLAFFIALGALLVWRDHEQVRGWLRAPVAQSRGTQISPAPGTQSDMSAQSDQIAGSDPIHGSSPVERTPRPASIPILWRRPWLVAAGVTFGAAAAVKWSGLYALAAFLIFITVSDMLVRFRQGSRQPLRRGALQACVAAALTLPAAALTYVASWIGWIVSPGGWGRTPGDPWWVDLARYHADMLAWHSTLSAPHPFQSHPLSWPLALRPTAMYEVRYGAEDGCGWATCVSGITPLPNPLVTWGGVVALGVLAWLVILAARAVNSNSNNAKAFTQPTSLAHQKLAARPDPIIAAGAFVLTGYLSGWLPWVLMFSRSAVFQFYAVVLTPFSALALALVIGIICGLAVRTGTTVDSSAVGANANATYNVANTATANTTTPPPWLDSTPEALRGRRIAVACFGLVALLIALLFFPVWSGAPVAEWFWRAHMWLPGWE